MKRKFERFLKNRRLFSAFIRNAENPECSSAAYKIPKHVSTLMFVTSTHNVDSFISASFRWGDSPEGHWFWSKLSQEWFDECY